MTEKYGACKLCRGRAKIARLTGDPSEGAFVTSDGKTRAYWEECPRCDGTGFSGDAMERENDRE